VYLRLSLTVLRTELDMTPRSLHFVMFSNLLSHGGGRETWLNNILPALLERPDSPALFVYYMSDASCEGENRISAFMDPRITFIETRLPMTRNKLASLARIAKFCWSVTGALRRRTDSHSAIVGIGTFYEGAVIALASLLGLRRQQLVLWIRGVWVKEINHRHGQGGRRLIASAERFFMRRADKVIANGQDTKAIYETLLGHHVEAIPNALDLQRFALAKRPVLTSRPICVSYIGRLSEEKGLRAYLGAIDHFLAQPNAVSDVRFEIAGDGPLRELAEACESRHPERVRYLGAIRNEDMPAYLDSIDLGVCLTYSKESGGGGVSNGLLELIGTQRLVVAWDSIIFRQVLGEDEAVFIPEGDLPALAAAFAAAASDPAAHIRKVQASRAVIKDYSLDAHVSHFLRYLACSP